MKTWLVGEEPVIIPGLLAAQLAQSDQRKLKGLVGIRDAPGGLELTRKAHAVGRAVAAGHEVVVPPDLPLRTFLGMLAYSFGVRLSPEVVNATISSRVPPDSRLFMQMIAAVLVGETEKVARGHISQEYVRREERLQLLRGRPLWGREIGRPLMAGVTCRFSVKATDSLLNRLVLTGLVEAHRTLTDPTARRHADTQVFIWRSLAEPMIAPRRHHFEEALRGLSRHTEHYRAALQLSQSLLLGIEPPGAYDNGPTLAPLPRYNLPVLFERLLARLVADACAKHGLSVRSNSARGDALVDGDGDSYQDVRPDLVIMNGETPVAVIDAKYKPRYLVASGGGRHHVTPGDIYQLFFYAERLARLHGLPSTLPAFIVAPRLDTSVEMPSPNKRSITWRDPTISAQATLKVVPLPLNEFAEIVLNGGAAEEVLEVATDVVSVIDEIASAITV